MNSIYGVIGDPIGHSLSPVMHNEQFQQLEIAGAYHPFHVKTERLEDAINGIKALQIKGVNVTIPHKVHVMKYLDEIDPLAKAIGAVNTIVNEQNKLKGYNTDGPGYVRALTEFAQVDIKSKSILIIGAGGAARAIYYSLVSHGVKRIDICNRTIHNANKIIEGCPFEVESSSFVLEEASGRSDQYDIIIQTTSIGMYPDTSECAIELRSVKSGAIVSDIIYNPFQTQLLKQANLLGAKTQNGLDMFLFQGALAFEKWTGIFPNIEQMRNTVTKHLGG